MNPWAGAAFVVAAFAVLIVAASSAQRHYRLHAESARKLVHLGGGLIAMSFPWLFRDWWPVAVGCGVSAVALFLIGRSPRLASLQNAIGSIDRHSRGEFYFPLAVLVVFLLARGDALLFVVPVLVLTFADAAAGIVGVRYGRTRYSTAGEFKTMEGSAACFAVAAVCTWAPLTLATDLGIPICLSVALLVGLGAAVFEAATTLGLDNLIVPLFVFAMLHTALAGDHFMLAIEVAFVLVVLILVMRAGPNAFARRMRAYLGEMLPLPGHAVLAALIFAGIAVYVRHTHHLSTSLLSVPSLIGVTSLFLLMLTLRLMDELKDEDIDRALFPERPLPSGRVRRADIVWSLVAVSLLFLGINLWSGWAFFVAAMVLGYAVLMLKRFFAPERLRRSLLLTLATHNPIVALMILYGVAVLAAEHGLTVTELNWGVILPFVVMVWSPFLAWELARKIRSPQEETDYVTYSRILGRKRAVLVTWAVQAVAIVMGVYVWASQQPHWAYLVLMVAGFLVNVWAGGRFMRDANPRTSRLKPFATAFVLCVLGSQIIGFATLG
jgi:dolichol kinase/4-hydroxybenzoate polyprenyltransferase